MKRLFILLAACVTGFALNIATVPANATAIKMSDTVTIGDLSISAAWSRSSAGMKRAGAAFMAISNAGTTDDRLIAASTPAAKKAELHTHLMENDVMKMRQVMHIDIPAGKTVELKPGGLHVMLFELSDVFQEGHSYPLLLTFEKAGDVTLTVHVGKAGAMGSMKHEGHMKHNCMALEGQQKQDCDAKAAKSDN